MKNKIPNLFFKKKKSIDFKPEDIDWNDSTVCVLCRKVDCICTIQKCPCKIDATNCEWPSDKCPCPKCYEILSKCKCLVYIKKEK